MPLSFAPPNTEMEVRKISVEEKTKKHLQEMGITVGSKVTLLSSGARGVIIVVKEGRLCLDGSLASRIMVS